MQSDIKDRRLATGGRKRMEWVEMAMPVLGSIKKRMARERPFRGVRVAACLHVTTETAALVTTLQAGGAEVRLCASNPLSTQDDVAAALVVDAGLPVFAIKGENHATYYRHIRAVLAHRPHITMDDGADLVSAIQAARRGAIDGIIGGTEETTTGVIRLKAMARQGKLPYPIIAVNDADTKHLFDNQYGTGQSTIDGILRATNRLLAGSRFVVCGYGWCGRGVARRAAGHGAHVTVVEVDPVRALEAVMDGYQVLPIRQAARAGEIFVTVTGCSHVIGREHFQVMRDGAIVANAGHFDVEVDIAALTRMSRRRRQLREFVEEYTLRDGRRLYLLAQGRLVNLAAAEGHPASVMDMSFANQALSAEYLVKHGRSLRSEVYPVPREIDRWIARLKLKSLGVAIDHLTREQSKYLSSWEFGT